MLCPNCLVRMRMSDDGEPTFNEGYYCRECGEFFYADDLFPFHHKHYDTSTEKGTVDEIIDQEQDEP